MLLGETRELRHARCGQRPRAADVDIETRFGRRRLDIERLACVGQHLGERPGCLDRVRKPGRKNRAAVDRHHVVRAQRGKPDFEHAVRTAPRMQDGATAAFAMGVDELVDRRTEPRLRQRLDDERALPGPVGLSCPVLQRAAAAHAEMRAD